MISKLDAALGKIMIAPALLIKGLFRRPERVNEVETPPLVHTPLPPEQAQRLYTEIRQPVYTASSTMMYSHVPWTFSTFRERGYSYRDPMDFPPAPIVARRESTDDAVANNRNIQA